MVLLHRRHELRNMKTGTRAGDTVRKKWHAATGFGNTLEKTRDNR